MFSFCFRKERDRAREEHTSTVNKMFSLQSEGDEQQGSRYSVIPQIQKVCEVVDGFIYVANAEAHRRKHPESLLQGATTSFLAKKKKQSYCYSTIKTQQLGSYHCDFLAITITSVRLPCFIYISESCGRFPEWHIVSHRFAQYPGHLFSISITGL